VRAAAKERLRAKGRSRAREEEGLQNSLLHVISFISNLLFDNSQLSTHSQNSQLSMIFQLSTHNKPDKDVVCGKNGYDIMPAAGHVNRFTLNRFYRKLRLYQACCG
jgi:hypothetical protein